MPPPGGDVIGRRRLDPHLDAFRALGARIEAERTRLPAPRAATACGRATSSWTSRRSWRTENALMAAALTPGSTVIHNAASEPHVQDLARMLLQMGARIEGIGSNVLIVHGQDKLGGADYTIGPDYIEIGSFVALAAVTGGELRIKRRGPRGPAHDAARVRAARLPDGVRRQRRRRPGRSEARSPRRRGQRHVEDRGRPVAGVPRRPHVSIALALATQADGMVLIHEKMFENRLFFVDKLVTMGARVILCDPHRAVVSGPSRLHGERMESPDIRAGMAMLIAALCAEGESEIGNIRQIDRGYERIDERLRALGARIERVPSERVAALAAPHRR